MGELFKIPRHFYDIIVKITLAIVQADLQAGLFTIVI